MTIISHHAIIIISHHAITIISHHATITAILISSQQSGCSLQPGLQPIIIIIIIEGLSLLQSIPPTTAEISHYYKNHSRPSWGDMNLRAAQRQRDDP